MIFTKVIQILAPGIQWTRFVGSLVCITEIQRKTLKKNLQNYFSQVIEIWYIALPCSPIPSFYSKEGPRVQNGPTQGGPAFEP